MQATRDRLPTSFQSKFCVDPDGCWTWHAAKVTGYGKITWRGQDWLAHRASYVILVGPIPEGLQLDHLCRNRACINPEHLEPVTQIENMARGVHPAAETFRTGVCKRGHDLNDPGVRRRTPNGTVYCRPCSLIRFKERAARLRLET